MNIEDKLDDFKTTQNIIDHIQNKRFNDIQEIIKDVNKKTGYYIWLFDEKGTTIIGGSNESN